MSRRFTRVLILASLVLAASLSVSMAEEAFDLKVKIDLDAELSARLKDGDVVRLTVRQADQAGTASGSPEVAEQTYKVGNDFTTWNFKKILVPSKIYRLEVEIIRPGKRGPMSVRYLSALDKLPRKPVDTPLQLRLLRGHTKDVRHTIVMVDKDSDGVFRMSVFTA